MELSMGKAMTVIDHYYTGARVKTVGGQASLRYPSHSQFGMSQQPLSMPWGTTQNGGSHYLPTKSERQILFFPIA